MDLNFLAGPDRPPLAGASDADRAALAAEHALGRDMLSGYVERNRSDIDRWEVLAVERSFALPVRGPTGRASSYYDQAGVVDLVVRDRADGRILVVDHKTCHPSMVDSQAQMLRADFQASLYLAAWGEMHPDQTPAGFIQSTIVKRAAPRPPRLVKPKKKSDACPCGRGDPHVLSRAANQSTSGDLYRAAIREHGLAESDYSEILATLDAAPPVRYLRESVARTPEQIEGWKTEIYEATREMRSGRIFRNPRVMECPRCPYLPLCTMDTTEARTLYRVSETPNEEIDDDEAQIRPGHNVVSQSRLRTWYQCRQRESYSYRERLKPLTQPRALAFGSGIHSCLAEWYRSGGTADMVALWRAWYEAEYLRLTGDTAPAESDAPEESLPF